MIWVPVPLDILCGCLNLLMRLLAIQGLGPGLLCVLMVVPSVDLSVHGRGPSLHNTHTPLTCYEEF
jgi:hypothetical protein